MATKAQKVKTTRTPKYATQNHKRCLDCFRHNVIRYQLCSRCFKKWADQGWLTGFVKR